MAEELFHGGVCGGGNWYWNSSRNLYGYSSPCSLSTVVIQDVLKPHETLQMMGNSLSSSTNPDDSWINQDFLHDSGRSGENYSNILLQENYSNWQENDWINSTSNFSQLDSSVINNSSKQANQTSECAAITTCQELSNGSSFPLDTVSYSYNNSSSLLETLFDDTDSQETQQSLLNNHQTFNYSVNSNQFLPSFAKQRPLITNVGANFRPTSQSQFLPSALHCKRPNLPSFTAKHQNEEAMDLASAAKKASNEPAFKRPRIETPSPLPTFKVRKEKLGDRITALQQLVSPFGKTDTASVLHEAIEYIKYLHDQVNELSSPNYSKHRSATRQRLQADQDVMQQDLKSRGLCLVPISSTFPVAQTPTDFWTPTFGGSFK